MNRAEFCRYQEETFDAFCKRIIHNTSIDEKKKAETREQYERNLLALSEWELAAPPVELQSEMYTRDFLVCEIIVSVHDRRIADVLQQISPHLRDILLLYYFCNFTMTQIAGITDVPVSTVDYRHKQALRLLRQKMEGSKDA